MTSDEAQKGEQRMSLNASQRRAVWAGVVATAVMIAFPPWVETQHKLLQPMGPDGRVYTLGVSGESSTQNVGYRPLWRPSGEGHADLVYGIGSLVGLGRDIRADGVYQYQLEFVRFLLQLTLLWLVVALAVGASRYRQTAPPPARPH